MIRLVVPLVAWTLSVAQAANLAASTVEQRHLRAMGLEYRLEVRKEPRPNRVHILRVDLAGNESRPDVVLADDPDGTGPAEAALTDPRVLAGDPSVVAFVNTNPWDSLPDAAGNRNRKWFAGQPVDILGVAISDNDVRSPSPPSAASVWIDPSGKVSLGDRPGEGPVEAMAGFQRILRDGVVMVASAGKRHPRTAIGVDRTAGVLWLVVVDGRQERYSEGMTLHELGRVMRAVGCWNATNMDGGGSSIMGLAGADGQLRIVNSPSDRDGERVKIRPVPMILTIRRTSQDSGPFCDDENLQP